MKIQCFKINIGGADRWTFQFIHESASLERGQRVIPHIKGYVKLTECKADIDICLKEIKPTTKVVVVGADGREA